MDLKETLQFYRKQQGLSQTDLAEALDVSRQTVSKWETGAALPAAEHLLALSKLYGVSVDALLNGGEPESVPILTEVSQVSPPEPNCFPLSRRRLFARILGVVFLFDLVMFLLEFYLGYLVMWGGILCPLLRVLGCTLIGLVFARLDQNRTVDRAHTRLIGLAALALGLYVFFMPAPLLWLLYDQIAWIGTSSGDAILPTNPFFFFLGYTLADECTFASHMFLIAAFQLGWLRVSKKFVSTSQAIQPV